MTDVHIFMMDDRTVVLVPANDEDHARERAAELNPTLHYQGATADIVEGDEVVAL